MRKYTKTPWSYYPATENVTGSDDTPITKEFTLDFIREEDMDHALKCVNMHDELVEALEATRDFIAGNYPQHIDRRHGLQLHVNDVLAKAKGDA